MHAEIRRELVKGKLRVVSITPTTREGKVIEQATLAARMADDYGLDEGRVVRVEGGLRGIAEKEFLDDEGEGVGGFGLHGWKRRQALMRRLLGIPPNARDPKSRGILEVMAFHLELPDPIRYIRRRVMAEVGAVQYEDEYGTDPEADHRIIGVGKSDRRGLRLPEAKSRPDQYEKIRRQERMGSLERININADDDGADDKTVPICLAHATEPSIFEAALDPESWDWLIGELPRVDLRDGRRAADVLAKARNGEGLDDGDRKFWMRYLANEKRSGGLRYLILAAPGRQLIRGTRLQPFVSPVVVKQPVGTFRDEPVRESNGIGKVYSLVGPEGRLVGG
jgi:hypothetical protein